MSNGIIESRWFEILELDLVGECVGFWVFMEWFMWYDIRDGRVAEWFKAHAWKACVRAIVPQVRILSLPPL